MGQKLVNLSTEGVVVKNCENLPMSKMDGPFDKSLRETNFLLILSLGNLLKV